MTKEQQCLLTQKEAEITDLQHKLDVMERSLSQLQHAMTHRDAEVTHDQHVSFDSNSDALLKRLRAELEDERANTWRAQEQADAFQKRIHSVESEKMELEANLAEVQVQLKIAETQARLVMELQNQLHIEEESERNLRSKYEADVSNYDLRLRALEEERELNVAQLTEKHETAFKRLREEHAKEIRRVQELLDQARVASHESVSAVEINWNEVSEKHFSEEVAVRKDYSFDISASGFHDVLMERYLTSEEPQESLLENSETSHFELDSEVIFHGSDLPNDVTCNDDASVPRLSEDGPQHVEMSFTDAQWQNSTSAVEELNESVGSVDLAKELLIQQCRDLSEQLEERERQLEVLQEEVKHSAEDVEEARERWSKASEELEEAKWELEIERKKRIHCEEIISQKEHEEDNLKNMLSHLRIQQDNVKIMTDDTDSDDKNWCHLSVEELLKELREEKSRLIERLKHQEAEQKAAGDSVSNEVQVQLSSLQAQRDEMVSQLEQQKEKHDSTSVLLCQKTLQLDQANDELQRLKDEVQERVSKLQDLEKDKTDLESKLMCLKENLSNVEEEKSALEKRLQTLENQTKSMEKILESELKDFEV